jgi:2-iminobutanoate/2-iminopropanoate deaminase
MKVRGALRIYGSTIGLLSLLPVFLFSCQHKNTPKPMRETIFSENAPKPIGPYSQAIRFGNTVYFSGQIGVDVRDGNFVSDTDVVAQTHQVMKNIGHLLTACGGGYANIVKSSIFLKDMNDFPLVNEAYASYFERDFPARETVEVSRLPKDALVEISVIVVLP